MSFRLPQSLQAWETPQFAEIFCHEVERLPHGSLPLHLALSMGSHVINRPPKLMLLSSAADETHLTLKAGVFFNTVIAGCSCADDPSPADENNEYCELWFLIDRCSGITQARGA
jgi:hypothetical protein